ncbi:MAG TPA: nucleotide kinase domain-containing protein [Nocardioides sp.]|uniref:nucleotide kinase domain-containing protein n=1 Tax=Nocardioides sp. TaxID=35761 RepID=UPI002EDAEB9B
MAVAEVTLPSNSGRAARARATRSNVDQIEVKIAGRRFRTTEVFDTYWRFAARRQDIYRQRLRGDAGPWTDDPILRAHRFTNCYRAADRVSQYLIREVIYDGDQDFAEVTFRTLLFKFFNKIETWELLNDELGQTPTWADFDLDTYDKVLSRHFKTGRRLYSAAYVMAPPKLGAERKHSNHLRLLRDMMRADVPAALQAAESMSDAFDLLRAQPGIGDFLAFQYLIDLNYSSGLDFDEMDFVVAGPGARDGIRKCFGPAAAGIESEVISYMAHHQGEHFERLGLKFDGLHGRPLQLIDCQNLFCEVDKYARVAHPAIAGVSGRSRIKQKFAPVREALTSWFPPKWGINQA